MRRFWVAFVGSVILAIAGKILADVLLVTDIPLITTAISLRPVQNPGVAFGVQLPTGMQGLLIITALACVGVAAWRSARHMTAGAVGFGLIMGGAIVNLLDRIGDGLVTDYFRVGAFPVFNIADSCITIGVLLLLREWRRPVPPAGQAGLAHTVTPR
ncbi:MAG: signal peptidase II [Candidatus Peregrinibacteria bacterium Gr01-1014_25]|nr:MAG: signal peptidase II [Candidatus Peregrinibacteria bacterium Gr01-1014_25]